MESISFSRFFSSAFKSRGPNRCCTCSTSGESCPGTVNSLAVEHAADSSVASSNPLVFFSPNQKPTPFTTNLRRSQLKIYQFFNNLTAIEQTIDKFKQI